MVEGEEESWIFQMMTGLLNVTGERDLRGAGLRCPHRSKVLVRTRRAKLPLALGSCCLWTERGLIHDPACLGCGGGLKASHTNMAKDLYPDGEENLSVWRKTLERLHDPQCPEQWLCLLLFGP